MIHKVLSILKRHRETIAYLFFGVLTVIVNTVLFLVIDFFTPELVANTIAFFLAVQFAYFTNTKYVFCAPFTKKNFLQFWGMRIGTIFIDNGGMWLLLALGCHKLIAKCVVNAVIIILNYLFSKLIIFKKETGRLS